MPDYIVQAGDTIYDATYNVSGSLTEVDKMLEINTSTDYPMLTDKQLIQSLSGIFQGPLKTDESATYEILFTTPPEFSSNQYLLYASQGAALQATDSILINTLGRITFVNSGYNATPTNIDLMPSTQYHVVWSKSYGENNFYINGNHFYTSSVKSPGAMVNRITLTVGSNYLMTNSFDGEIYKVRVFNYPMTDSEMLSLWNNGDPINYEIGEIDKTVRDFDYISDFSTGTDGWTPVPSSVTLESVNSKLNVTPSATDNWTIRNSTFFNTANPALASTYRYMVVASLDSFTPPTAESSRYILYPFVSTYVGQLYLSQLSDIYNVFYVGTQDAGQTYNNNAQVQLVLNDGSGIGTTYTINRIAVRSIGCVGEYIAANATETTWRDSSGQGNTLFSPITSPAELIYSYDVPSTNQFETYTPDLSIGQALLTTGVVLNNLDATTKTLPFNSSYTLPDIVDQEINSLVAILDSPTLMIRITGSVDVSNFWPAIIGGTTLGSGTAPRVSNINSYLVTYNRTPSQIQSATGVSGFTENAVLCYGNGGTSTTNTLYIWPFIADTNILQGARVQYNMQLYTSTSLTCYGAAPGTVVVSGPGAGTRSIPAFTTASAQEVVVNSLISNNYYFLSSVYNGATQGNNTIVAITNMSLLHDTIYAQLRNGAASMYNMTINEDFTFSFDWEVSRKSYDLLNSLNVIFELPNSSLFSSTQVSFPNISFDTAVANGINVGTLTAQWQTE